MNENCKRWERWIADGPEADETAQARHLEACPVCREQWTAHQALSGLAEIPAPHLTRDLSIELIQAVSPAPEEGMMSPTARRVMRVYWLIATFVAGLILAQLDSPTSSWLVAILGVATLLMAATPALLLLRRRLSWGLSDLVLWTLH